MAKKKPTPTPRPRPRPKPVEVEEIEDVEDVLIEDDPLTALEKRVTILEQRKTALENSEGNRLTWIVPLAIAVLLTGIMFFAWPPSDRTEPTPDPFGEILDGKKEEAKPAPVVEKKLVGSLLIIHDTDPITPVVEKMLVAADDYRTKATSEVFQYLSLDVRDPNPKTQALIKNAAEQNIQPPFVVFKQKGDTTYTFSPRPDTFQEIVNKYGK